MMNVRLLERAAYRRIRHSSLLIPFVACGKQLGMFLRTLSLETILNGQMMWAAIGANDSQGFGVFGAAPTGDDDDPISEYRRCWSLSQWRNQERILT